MVHRSCCNNSRNASTQVLVNGVLGGWIYHRKGLRQGDPLSQLLFILVMDVLNALFTKEGKQSLLQPLSRRAMGSCVSLYAIDVALLIHHSPGDLSATRAILETFGEVPGLHTNMQKSLILLIQCSDEELAIVTGIRPSDVSDFACRCLALPLSTRKLIKVDLMYVADRIVCMLPGWKATLLSTASHSILVKVVLMAVLIHILTALEVPKWLIRAINKHCQPFLWKG
ncbi:hypothetical protein U9M48_012847 [Paspalum notatum var. saurae]|uniref:Reverse transcriptase domain-containing protein n=1 Tax=Paspalum notatum var. saurae TaxID=547442 RepID=A0AAQ3SYF9_PASNO